MQTIDILKPCPCGTGINFENCCQPHLLGLEKPATAEKLMRSRYTAFVAGEMDYVVNTHHPETVHELDRKAITAWSESSDWQGLEMVGCERGGEQDDEGTVEFVAKYLAPDGEQKFHHETSLFKKHEGAWYFYDVQKRQPVKKDAVPGRNDPCLCGSGKKYKKCCLDKA